MKAPMVIGIDVGGTKIRVGRIIGRKIVASLKVPTDAKHGSAALMHLISTSVDKLWIPGIKAIGVGMAGLVDHEKGVFLEGPNLPKSFSNVPVAAQLKKRFKVPVKVDNDVHCFTLAEAEFGAGKGYSSVVGLTFGTGIGGSIAINGRILRGRNNGAGEFGHSTIALDSKHRCGCGRAGHFEAFASGTAMSSLYRSFGGKRVDAIEVERLAKAGDARAKRVFALMSSALAAGLANVIHTINPDIIVVGGGLSAVKTLWKPALKECRALVSYAAMRSTPIVRSPLSGDASVIGAALLTQKM